MVKKYSKEEKNKYFENLRKSWKESKVLADNDETAKALFKEVGGNYSYYSFYFTLMDMKANGFEGTPYIDCKTYKKWTESGFKVIKGEKSKIKGIVWLEAKTEDQEEGEGIVYPKEYHLFHTSQVEEIKK